MANYVRTFLRHLHNFSTPCGITCGKVIVFHWNLCGFFPKPWENPLWTSCFPPWKRKILLFWEKSFSDNPAHTSFLENGKIPPPAPVESRWKKYPFPILREKTAKNDPGGQVFQNSQTAEYKYSKSRTNRKRTADTESISLFHRFNTPYCGCGLYNIIYLSIYIPKGTHHESCF